MKRLLFATALLFLLLASGGLAAAERKATLAIDGMTCPACPFIVERALWGVDGVSRVEVSYSDRRAVVDFDDTKTDLAALTAATAGYGFPSRPVEPGGETSGR
jgi:mercuric ion binding protein